jgi:hypothetical protein
MTGARPVVAVLIKARDEAAVAFRNILNCDPFDGPKIRDHQNEIRRFDDLVRWFGEIVAKGLQLEREMDIEERDHLADLLKPPHDMMYSEDEEEPADG